MFEVMMDGMFVVGGVVVVLGPPGREGEATGGCDKVVVHEEHLPVAQVLKGPAPWNTPTCKVLGEPTIWVLAGGSLMCQHPRRHVPHCSCSDRFQRHSDHCPHCN